MGRNNLLSTLEVNYWTKCWVLLLNVDLRKDHGSEFMPVISALGSGVVIIKLIDNYSVISKTVHEICSQQYENKKIILLLKFPETLLFSHEITKFNVGFSPQPLYMFIKLESKLKCDLM